MNDIAISCIPYVLEENQHHYPTISEISEELKQIRVNKLLSRLYNNRKLRKIFLVVEKLFG